MASPKMIFFGNSFNTKLVITRKKETYSTMIEWLFDKQLIWKCLSCHHRKIWSKVVILQKEKRNKKVNTLLISNIFRMLSWQHWMCASHDPCYVLLRQQHPQKLPFVWNMNVPNCAILDSYLHFGIRVSDIKLKLCAFAI